VSVKVTVYGVPATTVWVDCTVRVSEPVFVQFPVEPSDPPIVPKLELVDVIVRAVLSGVVEPVSPVRVKMDCTVLQAAKTGTLLVRVMVTVLEEHGNAEFCPMEDVMLAALIFKGSTSSIAAGNMDSVGLKLNTVVLSPRKPESLLFIQEKPPPEFEMLPVTDTFAGPFTNLVAGFCTTNESTKFMMYGCPDWLPTRSPGVRVFTNDRFVVL